MSTRCLRFALLVSVTWPHVSTAQEQTAQTPVEEIIVEGVRTPVALEKMPTAVSVIDRDLIDLRQSFGAVDLLRDLAGISIARTGGVGGQAQLRLRGAEANHVLVIIDGIEVNDPASADEFLYEHLTTADIERIEVIRGPQSALWGSDAVSGVISITTAKPTAETRISTNAEYGSFDTVRGGARLTTGGDGWYLSATASHSDSVGTNIARTGSERDGYRNTTFGGTLGLSPSPIVNLMFTARRNDAQSDFDPVDFYFTGLPTDGDRVTDTGRTYLGAKAALSLLDDRLQTSFWINWIETKNINTADGAADGIINAERLELSAQALYEVSNGHRLTVAVDHEISDFHQRGAASLFGDPNQDQDLKATGLVLDYLGEFESGFTAFASVRQDENSAFRSATSWRLGGNYRLTEATRIRASVGTGQKAPTFTERYGFFADVFLGNAGLKPERSRSFEIGIDHSFGSDDAHKIGITYFNARLTDEIDGFVFDPDTFLFTAANSDGKSKRQGIEAMLSASLTNQISLHTNYTYIDATEEDGTGMDVRELRRPKHQGSAALYFRSQAGLKGALNISYVGDALDIFFPPYPDPSQILRVDSYWLASLAVEYPLTEQIAITGRIENAFDSDYEDIVGFRNPGRAVYGGFRAHF